jgi:hypothetical protein
MEATFARSNQKYGIAILWKEGVVHGIESIKDHGSDVS